MLPLCHRGPTISIEHITNISVLDDQRYGICANLVESPDRRKSYTFPKQSIFRIPDPLLIVKPNSRITISDMKSCNKFKLGESNTSVNMFYCYLNRILSTSESNNVSKYNPGH